MESNNYLLSKQLKNRIQGLVGEIVALDYVLENIKIDDGDEVIITTNRCNKLQFKEIREPTAAVFRTVNKSPFEFLRNDLVDKFLPIGCEGIDLTNADIEAKNLFEKYMSQTKEQSLSELERLYTDYRNEMEEMEKRMIEKRKEILKKRDINGKKKNKPLR